MPAIDLVLKTALPGLLLVLQTEHRVDHGNAVLKGDLLQCLGDDLAEMLRVRGLALQDHA